MLLEKSGLQQTNSSAPAYGKELRGLYCVLPEATEQEHEQEHEHEHEHEHEAAASGGSSPAISAAALQAEAARRSAQLELAGPRPAGGSSSPMAEAARKGAHMDPEPAHFVVGGYVDDVPQNGGGLAVFPRSHRLLHAADPASADLARYSALHPPHPATGAAAWVLPQPVPLKDKLAAIEPYGEAGRQAALGHAVSLMTPL
eukprot:SAG22_NODE_2181_length_2877_cov_2.137509_1_plen_201_part_00